MRSYILLAVLLLFAGCVTPPTEENTSNGSYFSGTDNVSGTQTDGAGVQPDYTVNLGDKVWVNYTLWVDGKVYDTSNAALANETGIYNPSRKYEPFSFTAEFNSGVIDGFIINILGMHVNDTEVFMVDPERGYGPYDQQKVLVAPRYYNKSLYETVPRSYFEAQGLNLSKGAGYETEYGTVFIEDFNDENVTIFYILQPGQNFTVSGIPQTVRSLDNLTATIEFMLLENHSYVLPHPSTGAGALFKVIDKNEQNITLDSNHPLAGKTLQFEVTVVDVQQ